MVRWRASLDGHSFDLADLPGMFTSPGLRVVQDESEYFLESSTFEVLDESTAVYGEARRLVPMINGAARLRSSSHRNVDVGHVIELTPDGPKRHAVVLPVTLTARTKVNAVIVRVGEAGPAPPPAGSRDEDKWMELAVQDDKVAKVLRWWGNKPHDWFNLYKVFEILQDKVTQNQWASRNEVGRFTRTANHEQAAGEGARHARSRTVPPARPMTLSEADAFVERLVVEWLRSM
jgi:hypothetical protein